MPGVIPTPGLMVTGLMVVMGDQSAGAEAQPLAPPEVGIISIAAAITRKQISRNWALTMTVIVLYYKHHKIIFRFAHT